MISVNKQPGESYFFILRPGIKEFLKSLLPKFKFCISTLAFKEYADKIVRFIDPENELELDKYMVCYGNKHKKEDL